MSESIEKEIKILLDESEYGRLAKAFSWQEDITQTNYYYVPVQSSRRMTIRVRQIADEYRLQLKIPMSEDGALHIGLEKEKRLSSLPDKILSSELTELAGTEMPDARLCGSLKTRRLLSQDCPNTEICLDKNEYLGKTDYEVEVEYTGDYPSKIVGIIENCGIDAKRKATGKYARFLNRLESSNL